MQALKIRLAAKLEEARSKHDTATAPELRAISVEVEALQKELSDTIARGAEPCPKCGVRPVGIEQQMPKGRVEFEVGCPAHPELKVRGGMIPRHAVEAWNEAIK